MQDTRPVQQNVYTYVWLSGHVEKSGQTSRVARARYILYCIHNYTSAITDFHAEKVYDNVHLI